MTQTGKFQVIDSLLTKRKYDLQLNPGLTDEEAKDFKSRLSKEAPEDLFELYKWHNGQSGYSTYFIDGMHWMTYREVITWSEKFSSEYGDFMPPVFPSWIPIMEDQCGNFYCIDPEGFINGVKFQIICFYHDDPTRFAVFTSLGEFVDFLYIGLENNLLEFFEDEGLGSTDKQRADIFSRIDSGL